MQIKLKKQLLVEDVYLYIELRSVHLVGWIKMFYQDNQILLLKIDNILKDLILFPLVHSDSQSFKLIL